MIPRIILDFASICAKKGIEEAVLSPGSRCAPMIIAFARHPDIRTRSIGDERSAAFIALGMALQSRKPSVLVCTSGSAAYNYAPAIAEAFFQQVPLIIFTADRPAEWLHQMDGQTIVQGQLYGQHVKKSYEVPVDTEHPDALWHAQRIISEAINLSSTLPQGPVHINVPIREPFYPDSNKQRIRFNDSIKIIEQTHSDPQISDTQWKSLMVEWGEYPNRLIIGGQQPKDETLMALLLQVQEKHSIPVVGDIISNLQNVEGSIQYQDVFLDPGNEHLSERLGPDLLITFGKSFISKNLKLVLRRFPPKAHWHLQSTPGPIPDTFKALTRHITCSPVSFFERLLKSVKPTGASNARKNDFLQNWKNQDLNVKKYIGHFFEKSAKGEFAAFHTVLSALPCGTQLHLANSMSVRYANFLGLVAPNTIEVFANRGTSGIDGSTSTALGAALKTEKTVVLLTGDMAFFYDRNAFWHAYVPSNLRVIVFNNHGGGIFRMIKGPEELPEFDEYFETHQPLSARSTASDFGMEYSYCNAQSELTESLKSFFDTDASSPKSKILEIESDSMENATVLKKFKAQFRALQ